MNKFLMTTTVTLIALFCLTTSSFALSTDYFAGLPKCGNIKIVKQILDRDFLSQKICKIVTAKEEVMPEPDFSFKKDRDHSCDIFNHDDTVDIEVADVSGAAPVPEPATLFLFGSGLLGLVSIRKRRK